MSTPEKEPLAPQKPGAASAPDGGSPGKPVSGIRPAGAPPKAPTAPPRPNNPATPFPRGPLFPKGAPTAAPPTGPAQAALVPAPPPTPEIFAAPAALQGVAAATPAVLDAVVAPAPVVTEAAPPAFSVSLGPLAPVASGTADARHATPLEAAQAKIEQSVPRLSDPELLQIARAMQGRDPEQSLDIPPPADVKPPEERTPDSSDPYIGTTFDHRYKIQKLLGEGGMGFVYLARHKVIDKKVAVKVLRADLAKDREILDRFLQEAKAASSIGNPHIVDISDFGDLPDGSTYFVMEFLEGQALSQLVDGETRLSVDRICHIGMQMCDGLAAAHAQGIIHRDLKPDNVYVVPRGGDPDFVKVLDFGIAKVSGSANTKLTKAGAVFGTPHYMSPEQAAGAPVDHRTDIYALGVMLYEMVSGQLPFNADNFMGILTQHMYKAPVPIRALVPGPECPPSLEAVVLKCLSKKPEARYQSMTDLAADLERVRSGGVAHAVAEMMARSGGFNVPADYFKQPNVIVPATPPSPTKKPPRYALIAGVGAAVVAVVGIFAVAAITSGTPAPKPVDSARATPSATAPPTATAIVSAQPPPVKTTPVAISATPDTAVIYRDNQPVHQVPWTIEVEAGKTVTIEIRADNWESQSIDLDGSKGSAVVKLVPSRRFVGGGTRPNGPQSATKQGDLVDPWVTKKKKGP
jgi:eukaryotic-like serine/threonine-protein kinase